MTVDFDKNSLAGAERDSAAGDQQVDTNSYQQEVEDYPVYDASLVSEDKSEEIKDEPLPNISPQAENFRALREEVDRMRAERDLEKREYQIQLDMLRSNMAHRAPEAQTEDRKFLSGLKDDDVPNVAELRREWETREEAYTARIEELQVAQQHPDYAEVIEKFALPLIKQKPHLAEGIPGARNKALFVYELGKMEQRIQEYQTPTPQRNENAQRMVENARKPGTLSQASGSGSLSKADYFATMSDQEFMRMANKNLEQI